MDIIAIIAAILFGVFSMFQGKEKEFEKNPKPVLRPRQPAEPKPSPTPSGRTYYEQEQRASDLENVKELTEKVEIPFGVNIGQIDPNSEVVAFDLTKNQSNTTMKIRSLRKNKLEDLPSISVKEQLTKKRIIESIIMSEVLGPPRAHKPYTYDYRKK